MVDTNYTPPGTKTIEQSVRDKCMDEIHRQGFSSRQLAGRLGIPPHILREKLSRKEWSLKEGLWFARCLGLSEREAMLQLSATVSLPAHSYCHSTPRPRASLDRHTAAKTVPVPL